MATITIMSRSETPVQLYRGEHANLRAAIVHCAANGVDLTMADLRSAVLDGADLSGLLAPHCDLTGASLRNITANRAVSGRVLELSAAWLAGAVISGTITHANLACTAPTALRSPLGPDVIIKGVNWDACPDVIAHAVTSRGTRAVSVRNGSGWVYHTGDRADGASACLPEDQARAAHGFRADHQGALDWLASAEGASRKAEIAARPIGAGQVIRPRGER